MIPGLNLLEIAFGAIAQQEVLWLKFAGNVTNSQGQDIPGYEDPVEVTGSFQSTDTRTIQELGLDTEQRYRTFYTTHPILSVQRSTSPDLMVFYGRKYQVAGEADWLNQDGWKGVILVDVGAA